MILQKTRVKVRKVPTRRMFICILLQHCNGWSHKNCNSRYRCNTASYFKALINFKVVFLRFLCRFKSFKMLYMDYVYQLYHLLYLSLLYLYCFMAKALKSLVSILLHNKLPFFSENIFYGISNLKK